MAADIAAWHEDIAALRAEVAAPWVEFAELRACIGEEACLEGAITGFDEWRQERQSAR